jgi:nucleoside-diphosphate-sugar epimerase
MGSERYPLRQCGIYRNLPTFDASLTKLKAVVVGATGISGFNTMRALLDSPERWETVYAISRSPPSQEMLSMFSQEQQDRIKHVSIDLTGSADKTSEALKNANVEADYIFFYGYLHPTGKSAMDPSTADDLIELNVPIFKNFLAALGPANLKPRRIMLQTGGKNYGGHIGRARLPYIESDPQPKHLANNFYYMQEEALFEHCKQNPGTDWNIVMPFGVVGAVPNAGMNMFLPFAIMASVQAEKREPITFFGDFEEWQWEYCHSTARLSGYLSEWAVLEDKCKNERFNALDGCVLPWNRFYSELARWYGVKDVKGPELDDSKFKSLELAGGKDSPLGYGPPPAIRLCGSFAEWAKDDANSRAWKQIMEKSGGGVKVDVFESGLDSDMADFVFYRIGQPSVAKLRRFGFNGFVDTMESVFEMFQDMAKMGIIPAPIVDAAKPMI